MITQKQAVEQFLNQILTQGVRHKKFLNVYVRPAVPGEVVVTVTKDGKETQNTAKENDVVLRNCTGAQEMYIASAATFSKRYHPEVLDVDGVWEKHAPKGEVTALTYTGNETSFEAKWGEAMVLKNGDQIVTPEPDRDQVYRIAAGEFAETYAPV